MKSVLVLLLSMFACSALAENYKQAGSEFLKGNYARAAQLYSKACDGGTMEACTILGLQ